MKAELAEINYELAWRKLCRKYGYTPNQQVDRKWDGQPRDRGRYSFGKKPELVAQPAAMRRGPLAPPATPAQQARLAIANAQANEAVARVRQLDSTWPRPQSLTSRDNRDDVEVMIRAKEQRHARRRRAISP